MFIFFLTAAMAGHVCAVGEVEAKTAPTPADVRSLACLSIRLQELRAMATPQHPGAKYYAELHCVQLSST